MTPPPSMTRPGSPTEPGLVERLALADRLAEYRKLKWSAPMKDDVEGRYQAVPLTFLDEAIAALRSPLPDREGKEEQEVRSSVAESAAAPQAVCPADAEHPGLWAVRKYLAPGPWSAHGGGHIWAPSLKGGQTIIGEVRGWGYLTGGGHGALGLDGDEAAKAQDAVLSFMVAALNAALGDGAERVHEGKLRDDLNSTSIPSGGDALKEALSKRSFVLSGPHLSGWTLTLGFEHRDDVNAAHEAVARLALSPPQSSRGTGE